MDVCADRVTNYDIPYVLSPRRVFVTRHQLWLCIFSSSGVLVELILYNILEGWGGGMGRDVTTEYEGMTK
jgi:hypothetical protein